MEREPQVPVDPNELIHELEVHQAELEAQNQQLRDAQIQLEDSRARYADLYDFAPVAYCTLDATGLVLEINLTGAAMLGTQRGRVIGKPFAVFVTEADRAAFRDHLQHRLATPQGPEVVELTLAGSAKEPIVVRLVSVVTHDPDGAKSCRSTFTDITEQKRAEEALQLAVQMRQQFLAIVSHDLRNPLNSVLLGAEVLQRLPTLDAASHGTVAVIQRAAKRMSHMLSDLLDLSSMDAGHLSMERKLDRVEAVLAAAIEAATAGGAAKSIRFELELADPDLVVFCDRDRILQVLMNLIGNAIKFSKPGSVITLGARRATEQVEIFVRDSGTGIAQAQLDHIFDPYWQTPNTAKLGTGLGLSIARGIVEFHDGRIWAASVLERGSVFYFTLPVAPDSDHLVSEGRRSGPLTGRHLVVTDRGEASLPEHGTILIVDDEADVHVLLTDLLRREGYEVASASDGAEALDYLRTTAALPCLILLDLIMPKLDGWQFIEERSHDPRWASIPIVLISGQVAARETARALGLASYIEKPIGIVALRKMLGRLRKHTSAAPLEER